MVVRGVTTCWNDDEFEAWWRGAEPSDGWPWRTFRGWRAGNPASRAQTRTATATPGRSHALMMIAKARRRSVKDQSRGAPSHQEDQRVAKSAM